MTQDPDDLTLVPTRWQRLFAPLPHPALWPMTLCYIVGSLVHLRLDDAWRPEWFHANLWFLPGLLLLWGTRGALPGWLFCIPATAIPLLTLRDHLTQSALLLVWASLGTFGHLAWLGRWRWPRQPERFLVGSWQVVTLATYMLASLHKINTQFLDPTTSCAHYGAKKLLEYWRWPEGWELVAQAPWLAWVTLAMELLIPLLYLFGRRRWARVLAVAFHIPLTLVLAPAFAFVMLAGHASFITPEDLEQWGRFWRREKGRLLLLAGLCLGGSLGVHGSWPGAEAVLKEALLWGALWWCLRSLWEPGQPKRASQPSAWRHPGALVVGALMGIHGLFPYLGLEMHHVGAMLSNLRVDQGCWNSLVFPESMRLREDYVRVDTVWFGTPSQNREYETIVKTHLWSPPQLAQMQRNWCPPHNRPFVLGGSWRGERFLIKDVCEAGSLEVFRGDGIVGVNLFGGYLRFQKNLLRACPQACIH